MALLKIENCSECRDCDVSRDYTADSWEYCERYKCRLKKKDIARYVERKRDLPPVPDWCPKIEELTM